MCVLGYCRSARVDMDLFVNLRLGRDLLALVVIDLVSMGLNLGKKQLVTLISNSFLSLSKVVLRYSVSGCLDSGNSWSVIGVT